MGQFTKGYLPVVSCHPTMISYDIHDGILHDSIYPERLYRANSTAVLGWNS